MVLQFCPVCKSLLQLRDEDGKVILYCNCGFIRRAGVELSSSETRDNHFRGDGVIKDEDKSVGIDYICKKCGYDKAELIDLGERNTNENQVFLYKCLKCQHSERKSSSF